MRREVEDHGAAVCVLPYDPVRRTAILVRQFRAPVFLAAEQEELLEAIAGLVSPDPAACGRREAMEEAGLALHAVEHVASVWTMPGVSTEFMHLYLAPYGRRIGRDRAAVSPTRTSTPRRSSFRSPRLAARADAGASMT